MWPPGLTINYHWIWSFDDLNSSSFVLTYEEFEILQ